MAIAIAWLLSYPIIFEFPFLPCKTTAYTIKLMIRGEEKG